MARKATVLILLATLFVSAAQPASFDELKRDAEKYFAEKSFARAKELYEEASRLQLSPDDRRWVEFRLADASLRNGDEAAREKIEAIANGKEHDRIWAEANESLGDYWLERYDFQQAQRYYAAALDWWAGSDQLALARQRYLGIVFRATSRDNYYVIPRDTLINAIEIAESKQDRAHARFLLAMHYLQAGPVDVERALELFEQIIADGKTTEWYDDALWQAANQYAQQRPVIVNGAVEQQADFARALELFRRLANEYAKGESPWRDDAVRVIEDILAPSVSLAVGQTFLPDSEQEVILTSRNVKSIELALIAVDLTKDLRPRQGDWTESIVAETGKVVRRWTHETNDKGTHEPIMTRLRITPKLERGAYLITASANSKSARQLLLVTDAHIITHTSPRRMEVFVSDVLTGEPLANARVSVWQQRREGGVMLQASHTNASGLARVELPTASGYGSLLVTAASGDRQAMVQTYSYGGRGLRDGERWKIYAFTDRPAYRPEETVRWKIIARTRDRETWATPAGQRLTYDIMSPRGEKVASGEAKLNEFGSFWSELALTPSMPLGVYNVQFRTNELVGSAPLFRLEEYKLPEFAVTVKTPKLYRLGDTIEAAIEAHYYFGGPVANATVEAVIYQQPYVRWWFPWREYPWYYDPPWSGGSPEILKRETLRTDAEGRAIVRIETPRDGVDRQYRIEARVVDASRREVRGEGNVRVMKQRYSVIAFPEHYIHRPNEQVEVEFRAVDANDQPVRTEGTVGVVRRVMEGGRLVRPEQRRTGRPHTTDEEVTTAKVATDAEGHAKFSFTPRKEGYYAIQWSSFDGEGTRMRDLVTAETAVWVVDKATTDLGYRSTGGALEIIADKETLKPGETANLMLVTPVSGRWVLLTASGDDILDTQVVRLDGTVKLVQMPVDSRHVPNFFVTASSVFDRALSTDTERLVVPPVEHFVTVDVKTDREEYEPREEGTVTITTKDASGKPVAAEVSLAVSDEAVTAIQTDLAMDPRQFFFNERRQQQVIVAASVQSQPYVRLVEGERDQLLDDRVKDDLQYRDGLYAYQMKSAESLRSSVGRVGGVVREEAVTTSATAMPAPPPPPAVPAPMPQAADAANLAPQEAPEGISIEVRSDFRSTAFWQPDVITNASGTATVRVKYPEALTTWRATARATTTSAQFGMASSTARTNMPLIVRLQAPRFFVVGDRTVVSAVINNNTDASVQVTPSIAVEGLTLSGGQAILPVQVPAHGEQRVDWTVVAEKAGPAKLRVTGRGAKHGDAMEKSFVVYEHGIDKLIARSGKLRGDEALVRLDLPRERRATDLVVQVAPSLAVTMLDALPYLVDYPYGCTEQTMSRFLPAAIVARTLQKMGLDARKRIPKLDDVTRQSIARLYDMQHADGGWGWWKEGDSDRWMTAYVVWGFALARDAGMNVDVSRIERAVQWLDERLKEGRGDWDTDAWLLHAVSAWTPRPSANAKAAFDEVWTNRERLTAYSRALLALVAHRYGDAERAAVLVRNLENGAQVDKTPDQSVLLKGETTAETMATVHWGANGFWWRWEHGPVESTAFVLQALVTIDPKHKYVEPAMNWLVKNRRGAQWSNTRDTAISVLALDAYLRNTGEVARDVAYEVSVNGRVVATKRVAASEMLGAPSRFTVDDSAIADAQQEIRIRRTSGSGPLYFSAEARFVSLEEPVKAAGNELFVRREYFRLAPRPTLLKGVQYDRLPLRDRESIRSGERVEVVVTIETKNDYEYLLFEDLKPAGLEAVALQSGEPLYATSTDRNRSAWVYQELRDRKVAMFIDHLPQGVWEVRYTLRAETPGTFHALPLLGQAMYVPDVRANGDEVRLTVTE